MEKRWTSLFYVCLKWKQMTTQVHREFQILKIAFTIGFSLFSFSQISLLTLCIRESPSRFDSKLLEHSKIWSKIIVSLSIFMVLLIDNTVVSKWWFAENMKDDHMSYIIEEIKHWIVFQVRRFVSRMPWCEKQFKSLQKIL